MQVRFGDEIFNIYIGVIKGLGRKAIQNGIRKDRRKSKHTRGQRLYLAEGRSYVCHRQRMGIESSGRFVVFRKLHRIRSPKELPSTVRSLFQRCSIGKTQHFKWSGLRL